MTNSSILVLRQSCRALFRSLSSERPAIVRVREGEKAVRGADGRVLIGTGCIGVLPARRQLTIENRPGPRGRYVATAILPGDQVVTMSADDRPRGDPFRTTAHDRTVAAFDRAAVALDDPLTPEALSEHAVREVLLWLAQDGIGFGPAREPGFADRLRTHLAAEPDREWRAIEAARAMAVSEATLRRRLAVEGTGFGDLLADVRMIHALGLLQTTGLPVNRIALEVGYASASRFAVRFRARFGIAPSAVRGLGAGGGGNDRIGTANDRAGTAPGR